ncbi:hypothetical protein GY45DRAFT_1320900 [Cubamyces sp. BRFM 1775]|nr:hypothetical protein GY45DRAFT_1320900 [Cubamyces sp. BRFM 1775]
MSRLRSPRVTATGTAACNGALAPDTSRFAEGLPTYSTIIRTFRCSTYRGAHYEAK